jgi:putative N6-adenine-specific DNA methylase
VPLSLVATCAAGLEELLAGELAELGYRDARPAPGAVTLSGGWSDVYRLNLLLRTANRVLVELGRWGGHDGDALRAGARNLVRRRGHQWEGLAAGALFSPRFTLAVKATARQSRLRDERFAALAVKDGLVDGQRSCFGRRGDVERRQPDLAFRVFLVKDQATLLLDTSGVPLDRRGYRAVSVGAPVRETLAAACVLAGLAGAPPVASVVDPMCGTGTLLTEAAWILLGRPPGLLRREWAFERLPGFCRETWERVRSEAVPAPAPGAVFLGGDRDPEALAAARANLALAGIGEGVRLERWDAFACEPPPGPGLVLVNPPYGERLSEEPDQWRRLGDLLKRRFAGYRAVVLAGGPTRGKHLGLRPRRRLPVRSGPLAARILVLDLY